MKTMRARLTVTFVFLMVAMVAIVWGVNQWYLERFYISQKVDTIEEAYEVIDAQILSNNENGISFDQAMEWEQKEDGSVTEGNLHKIVRKFNDTSNISILMIDNASRNSTVYSTAKDDRFLMDRMNRYIFRQRLLRSMTITTSRNALTRGETRCIWRAGAFSPITARSLS